MDMVSVTDDIGSVDRDEWNAIAAGPGFSPFLEHEFLHSVEHSGCAQPSTGWYPRHILVRENGNLVAAAPAYVKTHSMGEFVFDQGLAQAAGQMGIRYYPKLVATLPFTPSPGYRFLISPGRDERKFENMIFSAMKQVCEASDLESLSLLYVDPLWKPPVEDFREWVHQYFLWENPGYSDFSDYVSRFRKNQRRNIVRERRSVRDAGIRIQVFTGSDLNDRLMDLMFEYYRSTNRRFGPWAAYFLDREWFRYVGHHWSHRILLFAALQDGSDDPVALSLVVRKDGMMIGRYWGCGPDVKNLHFELCYYAPIEYAIREGIRWFDPGMGSAHKARRGFGSREFVSVHQFRNRELDELFGAVLPEANRLEREAIDLMDSSVPWRT